MRYYNKNINNNLVIEKLTKRIINGIESTLIDYSFLYTEDELKLLLFSREELEKNTNIDEISRIEDVLKPLVFRTWEYENKKDNDYICWLKDTKFNKDKSVISSTFGNTDTFCDSVIGVKYEVNIDAFVGACEKDAATMVESNDKMSVYTIRELPNNMVINSYNLATPIITPKQVFEFNNNDYMSKHNEIILDGRYAKSSEIICIDDKYMDMAKEISEKTNIPLKNNKRK